MMKTAPLLRLSLTSAVMALGLAACATTKPPSASLTNGAQRAIQVADEAGAQEHAPLELRFAREKIRAAQQANAIEDFAQAQRLLEQAEVDAELALSRTKAEQTRMQVEKLSAEVRDLRQSIADNFGLEGLE
jgi:hypothetical protein